MKNINVFKALYFSTVHLSNRIGVKLEINIVNKENSFQFHNQKAVLL